MSRSNSEMIQLVQCLYVCEVFRDKLLCPSVGHFLSPQSDRRNLKLKSEEQLDSSSRTMTLQSASVVSSEAPCQPALTGSGLSQEY